MDTRNSLEYTQKLPSSLTKNPSSQKNIMSSSKKASNIKKLSYSQYRSAIQTDIALNSRFGQTGNNYWIAKNGFFYDLLKNSAYLLNQYPFYYYRIQEKHCDEFNDFYENYTDKGVLYHGTYIDAAYAICFFNNILCSNDKNNTKAVYGDGFYTTSKHEYADTYAKKYLKKRIVIKMKIHPCLVKKYEYPLLGKIEHEEENIAIYYFNDKQGNPIALIKNLFVIDFSLQKSIFHSKK